MNFLQQFRANPFLGIARGLPKEQAAACAETCKNAGLKFIEVPLNTEGASVALAELCKEGEKQGLVVGAGTVLGEKDFFAAKDAGAKFIVSPNVNSEIIKLCVEKDIPSFAGALTPSEIFNAWNFGAAAIKVFPVSVMGGYQYIKELRGPFKDIPFLACGGVKADNVKDYFSAGCDFVSFGASVFSVEDMRGGQWEKIEKRICQLLNASRRSLADSNPAKGETAHKSLFS